MISSRSAVHPRRKEGPRVPGCRGGAVRASFPASTCLVLPSIVYGKATWPVPIVSTPGPWAISVSLPEYQNRDNHDVWPRS